MERNSRVSLSCPDNLIDFMNMYDFIILDGSIFYFFELKDIFRKLELGKKNVKFIAFRSSLLMWESFNGSSCFNDNVKSFNKLREKYCEKFKIRESPYDRNLIRMNESPNKIAIISYDQIEMFYLSNHFKNIDFLYLAQETVYRITPRYKQKMKKSPGKTNIMQSRIFDVLYDERKNKERITKKIGSGKDGTVYKLMSGSCIKTYANDTKDYVMQTTLDKIMNMRNLKMPRQFVLPKSIMYKDITRKKPYGYKMEYVDGKDLAYLFSKYKCENHKMREIIQLMVKNIVYLHCMGFMLGDFNLNNFIYDGNILYFIDTDNYFFRGYPSTAKGDFQYSKDYDINNNYKDAVAAEYESFVLMLHYILTNQEAYLSTTVMHPEPVLRFSKNDDYIMKSNLDNGLKYLLIHLLIHIHDYTLLNVYQLLC